VQFDGFNAITGQHDPDLASMSRLSTDPRLDRQIRLRRSGAYDPIMGGTRAAPSRSPSPRGYARQRQQVLLGQLD
jgi:hypothetical protein